MKNADDIQPPTDVVADDPNEQPYPGYAREVAALEAKAAAARRGRAAPLPGPLHEAFAGEPRRLHGFTLQPVNAWLVAILVRIESPLIEIIRIWRDHASELQAALDLPDKPARVAAVKSVHEAIRGEMKREIKQRPDDVMEIVFCFVTEPEKLQEALDEDRKTFTKAARKLLGKLHPKILNELETACEEHYVASFATGLSISAMAPDTPGDGSVFCKPPAGPTSKTGSAGGSNTPAPS